MNTDYEINCLTLNKEIFVKRNISGHYVAGPVAKVETFAAGYATRLRGACSSPGEKTTKTFLVFYRMIVKPMIPCFALGRHQYGA